ncbi:MAG: hypothetical protein U0836_16340 [Pirellulales bacterium]
MPSEWREIFDPTFCRRIRDEVWKLLPDRLRCVVAFEPGDSSLLIQIHAAVGDHRVRGFHFRLPPLKSWEAREWMDQAESRLPSIIGAIQEHLPAIIEELTGDVPSRADAQ